MSQSASMRANPISRRFARALTGSQASGDAYAVATLEAIAEDAGATDGPVEPRQALYQVFLKIWGSLAVNQRGDDAADNPTHARRRPDAGSDDAAAAGGVFVTLAGGIHARPKSPRSWNDRRPKFRSCWIPPAGRSPSQLRTDVLIIEDEPIIAMDLEAMVSDLGHSVLRHRRARAQEAVAAIADQTPGLVLADIQLADGSSGLDAVNEILAVCDVPVMFITAYPERLLTGERPEPTFLITKPFRHRDGEGGRSARRCSSIAAPRWCWRPPTAWPRPPCAAERRPAREHFR